MQRSDFKYDLPDALIARHPLPGRSDSRLLCLDGATGALMDRSFVNLPELVRPGDIVVLNDTRVIRARLFSRKDSGGACEILVERITGEYEALAFLRASKTPRDGQVLTLTDGQTAVITGRTGALFRLEFSGPVEETLERIGHVPLPPYLKREDTAADLERYQTVYAEKPGAVAAPTAGLHFDRVMLERLALAGVGTAFVTLHVGAGTFEPMRVDAIEAHTMHSERVQVSAATVDAIASAKAKSGRVVAVGTTAVRALEAAAADGTLAPFSGETTLFIRPGYRFRVVDRLLTNFHLPESTLLMLVCAFGGREHVLNAYRHAVKARYRFFSYGDAMLVEPTPDARRP